MSLSAAARALRSVLFSASCRPAHARLRRTTGDERPPSRMPYRIALERYQQECNRRDPSDGSLLGCGTRQNPLPAFYAPAGPKEL